MKDGDAFAIVYADQGAPDLRDLIALRSVGALLIAGRFRVIDLVLSNLANSGIHTVGLITQRNYKSLIEHIGSGKAWDMSRKNGGLSLLPPYDLGTGASNYRGPYDALMSKRDYFDQQPQRFCLMLSTSSVYNQDYNRMMEEHLRQGADMTMLYTRREKVTRNPAENVFLDVDSEGIVRDAKYEQAPNGHLAVSLGACLLAKDLLVQVVEDICAQGRYNMAPDIIAQILGRYKVVGIEHHGYAGTLTSVKSYFDLNRDMLDMRTRHDLFYRPQWPVYTKSTDAPPVRFAKGCEVSNSLFGNACDIRGRVDGSVLFRGVTVDQSADVQNCIVMQGTHIGAGAHLRNVIIDKEVVIEPGARLVSTPDDPSIIRKREHVGGRTR